MKRLLIALVTAMVSFPVLAAAKFVVHDDKPMDDARHPASG